ncbi:MAG: METTL5 family protein [Candidatus Bathyarchaeia archaeon]
MRKKHLAILLSKLSPHKRPKLRWEAYTLDAESAAEIAHIAGQLNDDIHGKSVIDLGCGTGVLAISASLLGARFVVGVDIDRDAVNVAEENVEAAGAEVEFVIGDIDCIVGHFDTTIMNPPFGSWRRGADVRFLEKAIEISDVVYSLHKRGDFNREFLRRKVSSFGGMVDRIYEMKITIPRTFDFHQKERYLVEVDLYRILKVKC